MTSWREVRVEDVAVVYDGPHATPASPKTAVAGPFFLGISSLQNGRLDLAQSGFLSDDDFVRWTRRVTPQAGDVVFSYETRIGQAAIIPPGLRCALGRRLALMRPDRRVVDPRFLLYSYLGPAFQEHIRRNTIPGSTVDRILLRDFPTFPLLLPQLAEQRGIVATLGALDDKIESNRRAIALSRSLARALYLQARSGTTSSVAVADVVTFHNNRRVPLSLQEREAMPGEVPYYGATGVFGHVAKALFDQRLLLVGEDGSVVQQNGCPVTQYVWGPAWVNNHAHVLTGKGISTEVALLALERADVRPLITGAVQAKLSMGNLKRLRLAVPGGRGLQDLQEAVDPLFAVVRQRSDEATRLMALRDALLPELLSGRLRVPEASEAVDHVLV